MLFDCHSLFSAYTTTKLKLGGSSPLVITLSDWTITIVKNSNNLFLLCYLEELLRRGVTRV